MTFQELGLKQPILDALLESGYDTPTPIQEKAIPLILEKHDLLGCAQTGTGKTAAFALPLIQSLLDREPSEEKVLPIKILVLSPTRELAVQTRDNFKKYSQFTNLKSCVILGGVNQKSQNEILRRGVDIMVATPGRLLDLIGQRRLTLKHVEIVVLDEADTMLDMGFIHDVKKIIGFTPETRQTLMFSATMPKDILELAETLLKNYKMVQVQKESTQPLKINQHLYYVDKGNKSKLLMQLLNRNDVNSTLIFTRTKHGANKLADILYMNNIQVGVIHGDKSQSARLSALNNFKRGQSKVLIATDIAARGIDIKELSHVVNYEMPDTPETYVHRIGRTGRAGLEGTAISFCDHYEKKSVKDIERLTKQSIEVVNHDYPISAPSNEDKKPNYYKKHKGNNNNKSNSQEKNKGNGFSNRNGKPKWENRGQHSTKGNRSNKNFHRHNKQS